jgi:hypothetical protein
MVSRKYLSLHAHDVTVWIFVTLEFLPDPSQGIFGRRAFIAGVVLRVL